MCSAKRMTFPRYLSRVPNGGIASRRVKPYAPQHQRLSCDASGGGGGFNVEESATKVRQNAYGQ